jgi:pyruvate dehydrogenase E1 component beta subunit
METAARDLVADVRDTQTSRTCRRHAAAAMTVREALRDAMAEEMRSDERVFVMGEEVAPVPRRLQGHSRASRRVRSTRVVDTPITEYGLRRLGSGAAMGG